MNYIYTAVLMPNEDSTKVYARIPDLPGCITTGSSLQDAIAQITDAASGWLVAAEDERLVIPPPTPQDLIERVEGDFLSLIFVDTTKYRGKMVLVTLTHMQLGVLTMKETETEARAFCNRKNAELWLMNNGFFEGR
ncbi:MAG: type II toxin-antitoxin system HicB family antitoxin [Lachnospiraceae bacterium]|nr:type II toxin-antitoxin system HicB family antitoxin [Lachnospiraceae bacterium]